MEWLRHQPLWLLFLVIAVGCGLERIPLIRRTLGSAVVLFVGLFAGAIDPELRIPRELYELGLLLFVYTVGISCGPAFFRTLRTNLPINYLVLSVIVLVALVIALCAPALQISSATAAGFFAGYLTNTPALASITEKLAISGASDTALVEPIVGYSIAYPVSILAAIFAIRLTVLMLKIDYTSESKRLVALGAASESIVNVTVRVTRNDLAHLPISVLFIGNGWRALLGRRLRGDEEALVHRDTCLLVNDLVSVIGTEDDVQPVIDFLGRIEPDVTLGIDREHYDNRRIFLSNSQHFGRRIGDLNLVQKFEAIITRVRRGDLDFLAAADLVLEPGDRVRVVAPRSQMKALSEYLGDSYKALSEVDYFSFSLGLLAGFMIGQVPLPSPEGYDLRLGIAGGPLIAALVLGWVGRTGPLVWTLPYSANITLRQVGMVMFLAGVGTRAGHSFVSTLVAGGWLLMLVGLLFVFVATLATLFIGHHLLKVPMSVMIGVVAGMQTQPALLSYATQQTGNDSPSVGYASVYPLAMVAKILIAQALLMLAK
jgi:putative transport protein